MKNILLFFALLSTLFLTSCGSDSSHPAITQDAAAAAAAAIKKKYGNFTAGETTAAQIALFDIEPMASDDMNLDSLLGIWSAGMKNDGGAIDVRIHFEANRVTVVNRCTNPNGDVLFVAATSLAEIKGSKIKIFETVVGKTTKDDFNCRANTTAGSHEIEIVDGVIDIDGVQMIKVSDHL